MSLCLFLFFLFGIGILSAYGIGLANIVEEEQEPCHLPMSESSTLIHFQSIVKFCAYLYTFSLIQNTEFYSFII